MAEEGAAGKDDVLINIGAKADVSGAAQRLTAQFSAMEAKLKQVGTAEAQSLAKEISAVAKGLSSGIVDPKSVEELAQAFAKIEKSSQLSDKAIDGLSSKLDNAVKNSRSLSDHMRSVEASSKNSNNGMRAVSDAIDDLSPKTRSLLDNVGKWANRIPGVGKMLGNIATKVPGIGTAFKLVTAAVVESLAAIRSFNQGVREAEERMMRIRKENSDNERTNAFGNVDLLAARRKSEMADRIALEEARRNLGRIQDEEALYEENSRTAYAKQRQWNATRNERTQAWADITSRGKAIDEEIAENKAARDDIEKKIEAQKRSMEVDDEQLKKRQELVKKYDELRSAQEKALERVAMTGGADDISWLDKINEKLKNGFEDMVKDAAALLGDEVDTSDASALFKSYSDAVRQEAQQMEESKRSLATLENQLAAETRRGEKLGLDKEINKAELGRQGAKEAAEDALVEQERNERLMGQRVAAMGAGNRLTSMGLGGGNAGADPARDTARNTKELLGVSKDIKRMMSMGKPPLSLGSHAPTESSYPAATWQGASSI